MLTKIRSSRLTTCRVAADGSNVGLEFLDSAGATVTLELPFEQAQAVVMTLPGLLTHALKQRTGDDQARYVFGLREWAVERTADYASLIATLKTPDGFEVAFCIPFEACRSLGWILQQGADQSAETAEMREEAAGGSRSRVIN